MKRKKAVSFSVVVMSCNEDGSSFALTKGKIQLKCEGAELFYKNKK